MVEVEKKEQIQYIQKNTKISKEHTKKTVHTKSITKLKRQTRVFKKHKNIKTGIQCKLPT